MAGLPEVERQFSEVNAYNLFLSAVSPRASPSLAEHGWRVPMTFCKIRDPYEDVAATPDFILYDGDICLFVEIKSGNNIEEPHISQLERCNAVSINGIEDEFETAEVIEGLPYDGTVRDTESCIVYQDIDEEWVSDCRNEWDDCQEMLERLEAEAPVLTQDYGGTLRRVAGQFDSGRLQRRFNEGIELPANPKEEIMLTEQMEKEVLAVAICGTWGEEAMDHENPVQTNVNEIRDHFSPHFNVPPQKVNRVLYYLTEIGACNHVEDLTYEFDYTHLGEILTIKEIVRNERVESILEGVNEDHIPDERQATLERDYSEGKEDTTINGEVSDTSENESN